MSAQLPESNYPSILRMNCSIIPLYYGRTSRFRTHRSHNFYLNLLLLSSKGYSSGITIVDGVRKPWVRTGKREREEIGNIKTTRVTDILAH